jgi:hypothetical protein
MPSSLLSLPTTRAGSAAAASVEPDRLRASAAAPGAGPSPTGCSPCGPKRELSNIPPRSHRRQMSPCA